MKNKKNFTNLAIQQNGVGDDGQNIQHFISESPWDSRDIFTQIKLEIIEDGRLNGGILTLDESADMCKPGKAGAARQHNGRTGSVQMCQVGVVTGYFKDDKWMMVDADLFLPEQWFIKAYKKKWKSLHIPENKKFQTKPEIGFEQIMRAKKDGLLFSVVAFDSLYGRNNKLRHKLDKEGIVYVGDVPVDYMVYLDEPEVQLMRKNFKVVSDTRHIKVKKLLQDTGFTTVELRHTERGLLQQEFAKLPVWTFDKRFGKRQETLIIWRENCGKIHYTLSNAALETSLKKLGLWRNLRHFAERIFEDIKSETGWADLEARKYRAWMHHSALNALALWFLCRAKMYRQSHFFEASSLKEKLEIEKLPQLSMANVRELLRATFAQPQLSEEDAGYLVASTLVNRAKSTSSRRKKQHDSS